MTVSEVLPRERARWHERKRGAGLAQFLSVAVGFALMYLTTKYLGELLYCRIRKVLNTVPTLYIMKPVSPSLSTVFIFYFRYVINITRAVVM